MIVTVSIPPNLAAEHFVRGLIMQRSSVGDTRASGGKGQHDVNIGVDVKHGNGRAI